MDGEREALAAGLGDYDLGEELGRGGWAIVYAANDRKLGRPVAIKVLPRAFGADADVRARFEDEAQLAARLSHPHVVAVHDFLDASGLLAIVMERMSPRTLADRVADEGILHDTACALVIAVASALHAAHELGRVHRDVKPENVLFDDYEVPKLSDFGVAKIIGIGDGLTRAGDVIGTPAYMSPEQATGATVGPASDVYSTALVAYELLSGRLPFPPTDSATAQLYQHVHEEPIALLEANPAVAAPIAAAVIRGLERSPSARYGTAEGFAVALGEAATDVYGSGWLRDAGVDVRLSGRLLDAVQGGGRVRLAQRLPALTTRTGELQHARLGTVYDTAERLAAAPATQPGDSDDVSGFGAPAEQPGREVRRAPDPPVPSSPTPPPAPMAWPPTGGSPTGESPAGDEVPPTLSTFTVPPAPPRRLRRGLLAGVVAIIVVLIGLIVWGASRDQGDDTVSPGVSSTTSASPASTTGPVVDRDGQALEPTLLDGFESGCQELGLEGGVPFCRCARDRLGGAVARAEIEQATAFFQRQDPTLPPSVRAVMSSCTSG